MAGARMERAKVVLVAMVALCCVVAVTGLDCPLRCSVGHLDIVAGGRVLIDPVSTSNVSCAYLAKAKGYRFYSFYNNTYFGKEAGCWASMTCSYSFRVGKRVIYSGRLSACPLPPPPPVKVYCSANLPLGASCKACRYPFKCREAAGRRRCCCPPDLPNAIIKDGKLRGCRR